MAESLGDRPDTVAALQLIRRRRAALFLAGATGRFTGLIVQALSLPGEPIGYGADAQVLWELLQCASFWYCLNVAPACAAALGTRMERETGRAVSYFDDILLTLDAPAPVFRPREGVRLLSLADLPLLAAAPRELRGIGFGETRALLLEGVAAAALDAGRIVSLAHTSALTPRHAEISVSTLEAWRGRGLGTAAAALVCAHVQAEGHRPVWTTGQDNGASLRVARKLGFSPFGRRTYVILT
ncbi:MAG TPA: GNAT family N-acetyltransferase [Chloroflexota bacterium]|nr:GNAT family N-acetyltransferase [Chloroflexota bacterium]